MLSYAFLLFKVFGFQQFPTIPSHTFPLIPGQNGAFPSFVFVIARPSFSLAHAFFSGDFPHKDTITFVINITQSLSSLFLVLLRVRSALRNTLCKSSLSFSILRSGILQFTRLLLLSPIPLLFLIPSSVLVGMLLVSLDLYSQQS